MEEVQPHCIYCGSTEIRFLSQFRTYVCDYCGNLFDKPRGGRFQW